LNEQHNNVDSVRLTVLKCWIRFDAQPITKIRNQ